MTVCYCINGDFMRGSGYYPRGSREAVFVASIGERDPYSPSGVSKPRYTEKTRYDKK